jgi:hypothetical protein
MGTVSINSTNIHTYIQTDDVTIILISFGLIDIKSVLLQGYYLCNARSLEVFGARSVLISFNRIEEFVIDRCRGNGGIPRKVFRCRGRKKSRRFQLVFSTRT